MRLCPFVLMLWQHCFHLTPLINSDDSPTTARIIRTRGVVGIFFIFAAKQWPSFHLKNGSVYVYSPPLRPRRGQGKFFPRYFRHCYRPCARVLKELIVGILWNSDNACSGMFCGIISISKDGVFEGVLWKTVIDEFTQGKAIMRNSGEKSIQLII